MKDSSEYGARLRTLCNRLKRAGSKAAEPPLGDVITELLLGCLSEHTTESKARSALNKLRSAYVDCNELRVSRVTEVMEILGKSFPEGKTTAERLLKLLRTLYNQRDNIHLEFLKEMGKREAKAYLEGLDGISPYVVARVMLRGLDGHAFPVHEPLLTMLRAEEVVDPEADAVTIQGFLERHVTSSRIHKLYALLRWHADHFKGQRSLSTELIRKRQKKSSTTKSKKKTKT
ncbi:MAG: hypothetical protein JW810_08265, partial [Sedimentisphaerales bacterium]|nr:hypothetical protein [Sedimentisphaerales bacterium]